jgi:hypothetical protein
MLSWSLSRVLMLKDLACDPIEEEVLEWEWRCK